MTSSAISVGHANTASANHGLRGRKGIPAAQARGTSRFAGLLVMVLALIIAVTTTASAHDSGFNVNSHLTFVPLGSTYRVLNNTVGCPAGFAGKFTFTARMMNVANGPAMPDLDLRVQTLTNGNVLLDTQTNSVLGAAGAVMEVSETGQYGEGLLNPGESVDVPFIVCLRTLQPFQFFVDVFGVVTKLVSVTRDGAGANDDLGNFPQQVVSANGRVVAFVSVVNDLVGIDTNQWIDVFVHDMDAGTTVLGSVNRTGSNGGNTSSGDVDISADGRLVSFSSDASDLVNTPSGRCNIPSTGGNVFLRDWRAQSTVLISVDRDGNCGDHGPGSPSISADGRFVAFVSRAGNLTPDDIVGQQVYVRDMATGTTTLVSVKHGGIAGGNGDSGGPRLSADGRFVAFASRATDLVATDTNGQSDIFVRDLQNGTTTLVSINHTGTDSGNGRSGINPGSLSAHALSASGRFIVFGSVATDLVKIPTSGLGDIFVRDLLTGATSLVTVNFTGTGGGNRPTDDLFNIRPSSISSDGFVTFSSAASDLVPNDGSGHSDVFMRDLQTGMTWLVSINHAGTRAGNGSSFRPSMSADGRFVAFTSRADDLVSSPDANNQSPATDHRSDVFVRDMITGITQLMSVNRFLTDTGAGPSGEPLISANGRVVTFTSNSSDLVGADGLPGRDLFARPVR